MKRRQIATGAVALTTAVAMAGAGASSAHAAGRSTDNVRLTNSGPAALQNHQGMRTIGTAPSSTNVDLSLAVPLRNQALLNSMLAKGTVISPAEYNRLFSASPASLKRVSDWAKKQGLKVTSTDASNGLVTATAPVRTVNKAFSLTLQRVTLGSRTGLAPNAAPLVPRSLGVTSVVGLSTVNTFHTGPMPSVRPLPTRTTLHTQSQSGFGKVKTAAVGSTSCSNYWGQNVYVTAKKFSSMSNFACGYSPQQAVKMYNAAKGQNVKANIGVLLWCDDAQVQAKTNNLSTHYKYPKLAHYYDESAAENKSQCADGDAYGEQDMDVQTSHIISPQSSIYYYGASDSSDAALLSIFKKAVNQHKVSTISMSWGGDEQSGSFQTQFDRVAAKAAATGISLFASSGDMGDGSIVAGGTKPTQAKAPSYPATSPFFTAVGGTASALNKSGGRAFTAGWSTSWWQQPNPASLTGIKRLGYFGNSVGAGGGVSKVYAQPSWQKGKVGTLSKTKRVIPDVSAIADPATPLALEFDLGQIGTSGGTSQSSPLVAALVATSKAITGRKVGNAAPYFYKLKGTSNLRDVKPVAAGKYGLIYGTTNTGALALEGLAQPSDSLRVKAGWDDVTGLGEPTGSFLTAFGK